MRPREEAKRRNSYKHWRRTTLVRLAGDVRSQRPAVVGADRTAEVLGIRIPRSMRPPHQRKLGTFAKLRLGIESARQHGCAYLGSFAEYLDA